MPSYKIGGGSAGWAQWTGHAKTTGWEMKFTVDASGKVSGRNKNDGADKTEKEYTGTLVGGKLNVVGTIVSGIDKGQKIQYTGTINGNQFSGDIKQLTIGAGQRGRVGTTGKIGGPVSVS